MLARIHRARGYNQMYRDYRAALFVFSILTVRETIRVRMMKVVVERVSLT